MNEWLINSTLGQAAPTIFEEISKGFISDEPATDFLPLAYFMLSIGFIGLCWYGWRQWKRYTSYPGRVMILGLSQQFGISFEQRWWLERVAARAGLESPVTLLLGPATLEHHLKQYLTQAWPWAGRRAQAKLGLLSRALFQDLDEDEEGESSAVG